MSDVSCIYSREELQKLDQKAREELQNELERQIRASREIRAIINADAEAKEVLKDKLRDTYDRLSRP
jgi:ABC-type Fe3+/spermidine/putrescine transport system ATPase subunit